MTFYRIKDEYLPLWGEDYLCLHGHEMSINLLTRAEVQDICRGWGCEIEDIIDQLEVVYYEL